MTGAGVLSISTLISERNFVSCAAYLDISLCSSAVHTNSTTAAMNDKLSTTISTKLFLTNRFTVVLRYFLIGSFRVTTKSKKLKFIESVGAM